MCRSMSASRAIRFTWWTPSTWERTYGWEWGGRERCGCVDVMAVMVHCFERWMEQTSEIQHNPGAHAQRRLTFNKAMSQSLWVRNVDDGPAGGGVVGGGIRGGGDDKDADADAEAAERAEEDSKSVRSTGTS